mmetsp:Transcript_1829/g.2738  ORF Transcript_1829/g.2738 Transcript_1829/m.2738 type:complete len:327 (+) Transcript_1829:137-1117(+)
MFSSSKIQRLLLFGCIHGKRIEKGSKDSNGGSDDRSSRHGSLEGDNRCDDDNNTLDGISNSVSDGVDLSERKESNLIISIVASTSKSEEGGKTLVGEVSGRDNALEGRDECSSLNGKHQGDEDASRHGCENSVKILSIEVLSDLLSTHGLLGKNSTCGRRHVREHGRSKCENGERKLFHGCNSNSSNNREKGEVHRKGKDLSEEEGIESTSHNGLGCLDNVSKGNGSGSKGDDCSNVYSSVAKGDGEKSLKVTHTELRRLTDSKKPHGHEVGNSSGHLESGDGPWERQGIQGLLVVNVVSDVKQIPEGKVNSSLHSLSQSISSGFL